MIVMKFGGTSVGSVDAINRLVTIVKGRLEKKPVIVVSAFCKVTDTLYKICKCSEFGNKEAAYEYIESLRTRHEEAIENLIDSNSSLYLKTKKSVTEILDNLQELVKVICTLKEVSERSKARIVSAGELLSSTIICATLNYKGINTAFIDARNMMITNDDYMKAQPDYKSIKTKVPIIVSKAYEGKDAVITQGFISATHTGINSVLGRGGSDFTASLIGLSINAEEIEIWTDVDGIFTADPKKVPNSKSLKSISFEEASEMAHLGAKILHPFTIQPAIEKNIPLRVLNAKHPAHPGTLILQDEQIASGIKSLSFKENITVINIFSTTMINAFGFLEKVFAIFSHHKVSVDLVSTSEINVSLTLDNGEDLKNIIDELSTFSKVRVEENKAQISVIGKDLRNIKGVCTKVFSALEGYRVYMISQGAYANNLSFVVDKVYLNEIINKLHDTLFPA